MAERSGEHDGKLMVQQADVHNGMRLVVLEMAYSCLDDNLALPEQVRNTPSNHIVMVFGASDKNDVVSGICGGNDGVVDHLVRY